MTEAPPPRHLPLWQRLLLTVLVMLAASYVAGLIGGLSAIPVWDLLQRIRLNT